MSSGTSDEEEYAISGSHVVESNRYPIHDCCEFREAEALKALIFVPQEDSDDDDDDDDEDDDNDETGVNIHHRRHVYSSSSSDENTSTEAAHAAAIGHSPQPVRPAIAVAVSATETQKDGDKFEVTKDVKEASSNGTYETKTRQVEETTNDVEGNIKELEGKTSETEETADKTEETPDETDGTTIGTEGTTNETAEQRTTNETKGTAIGTERKANENERIVNESESNETEGIPNETEETPNETGTEGIANETNLSGTQGEPDADEGKKRKLEEVEEDGDVSESMETSTVDKSENKELQGDVSEANDAEPEIGEKQRRKSKKKQKFYCPHNLNDRDPDENTPIHVAIHSRKLEHVKLLLEAGASVHRKSDGSAPIHTAVSIGAIPQHEQFAYECVTVLNEYGADLTAKDDAMHTPLYLACKYNLPQVASYFLSTEAGLSTLNVRADRSGGRPLHAAAKFDCQKYRHGVVGSAIGHSRVPHPHHHPDGTVINSMHHIPGFPGRLEQPGGGSVSSSVTNPSDALVTQVLLGTGGIEIDPQNTMGQTPLHMACLRGNWSVVRLLLHAGANPSIADRRGFTAGQLAHKRGMPIPNDLLETLGDPPSSGAVPPPRDLIVDPDGATLVLCHELCSLHRSCPPIGRDFQGEPPPENVRRLHVLIDNHTGILRTGEFSRCVWQIEARRAAMVDILKCHEYSYVEQISQMCSSIPDHPNAIAHLDPDTTISRWSFEAALRAAGAVCEAVDKIMAGECRNAFCAVRPPGHHAGPRGIVRCSNDPDGGSHGFCLLNNVAIGAAYARSMYRNEGVKKVAIVDFDVHHGNGTEEIIRNLVPNVDKGVVRTPFAMGELVAPRYRPWLDETDVNDVFFASTHGYGTRGSDFADNPQGGWFYPASGKTHTSDAISNPSMVETPGLADFLSSQTWTRMGDESRSNCCKIVNCGLGLPAREAIPGTQRLELRDTYRQQILPRLREFDPDIIFISAGFDAHKKDTINYGYVGMVEDDYEWLTEQLVKIANTCCSGRIVSVLEGGYKIHGGIISPFARSVASHVRGMVDGGRSRELYDSQDCEWESQFERHLIDERERKRQQKMEKLRHVAEQQRRSLHETNHHQDQLMHEIAVVDTPDDPDAPTRKRKRNQVDYRSLFEDMKREGFAG